MGRVRTVYWAPDEIMAEAISRTANSATVWPGLTLPFEDSLTILLAPGAEIFDSLTGGRLPEWGAAGAYPDAMTIVLLGDKAPGAVLRHEMAHLALHSRIRHTPLWLSEGYAVWAAGEWRRLDGLKINLALVTGNVPTLAQLSFQLREGRARASSAYALAATTLVTLDRMGGPEGLGRLLDAYAESLNLDAALRQAYLITLDQFEETWRREIRERYGWLTLLTSFSAFWLLVGGGLGVLWFKRRRRDKVRRSKLDDGWSSDDSDVPTQLD